MALYAPCNIPLTDLIDWQKARNEDRKLRRSQDMQRGRLDPQLAATITRREAAVLEALKHLLQLVTARE